MSPQQVQSILAEFQHRAARVASRLDGAEVWRFAIDARQYELHYWEDDNTPLKKYIGGARAAREFAQLQTLQKLGIPATRVIANLKGFRIGDRKGDACIVVYEPAAQNLEAVLAQRQLPGPQRMHLIAQLMQRLERLHEAKLCPTPLSIDRFALRGDELIVADAARPLAGIVTSERLRELDRSTRLVTRAGERLRVWRHFTSEPPPRGSRSDANALVRDAARGVGAFGRIAIDDWVGRFVRQVPMAVPWSRLGDAVFDVAFWRDALPLVQSSDSSKVFKSDPSGIVCAKTLRVNGADIELIVKRPAFKPGLKGEIQRWRTARVARVWKKTWRMLGLGFACELPLFWLERRSGGRIVEQIIAFERVSGETMAKVDLDGPGTAHREDLLYACGRVLRRIEAMRFTHADAKNTNWIAWRDPSGRDRPVLIDLDGIRFYPWRGLGIERFVRAMKTHAQITEEDVRAIEHGYRNS